MADCNTSGQAMLVGKRFINLTQHGMECRVIAETEGYIVARYKGCVPFVTYRKDFLSKFQEVLPVPEANQDPTRV